ncbi:heavy metal-binding domain-containing protein, partial [Bacteroides fragilis]|nr:heavy metal-binding domain-containing protein [Bacteroides fragilis]
EMVDQAIQLEANGVIAVDIDYESVGQGDVMMVAPSARPAKPRWQRWLTRRSNWKPTE